MYLGLEIEIGHQFGTVLGPWSVLDLNFSRDGSSGDGDGLWNNSAHGFGLKLKDK